MFSQAGCFQTVWFEARLFYGGLFQTGWFEIGLF